MKPLVTDEYIGNAGVRYVFEYYETDSFDELPLDDIAQCYAIAFWGEEFVVVNNIEKPTSYTPVGGTVEPGERPDETLIREVREESNMKVVAFKPIGYQKVIDTRGIQKPYYQLRYVAIVEPYGPFVSDPAGKVTKLIMCTRDNYKEYFDWKEIGERLIERAYTLKKNMI